MASVYVEYGRMQTANVTTAAVLGADAPFFLDNKGGTGDQGSSNHIQTVEEPWVYRESQSHPH